MTNPTWQVGDVHITAVVELDFPVPFAGLLPGATPELVAAAPWLAPHWIGDTATMLLRFQALIIESAGRTIVVDTCVGNDKERPGYDFFTHLQTPFLAHLIDAGFAPDTVDIVTCTHLHVDHVGWNTRLVEGAWVPTFPNARYLFARTEYDHWLAHCDAEDPDAHAFRDSVRPIAEAGLIDFVDPPHPLTPEVTLVPKVGHTPGHCIVVIESLGERAVITGDLAHHPIQFVHPEIAAKPDWDQTQSTATRRGFIAETVDTETLVIGTHFAEPSGGRLIRTDGRVEFRPAE